LESKKKKQKKKRLIWYKYRMFDSVECVNEAKV